MNRVEFDSTKKNLHELLLRAQEGALQLPDFQRGWVWGDEGIRDLLVSISRSFPVGALMTLQSGGDVRFKARPIEGAPETAAAHRPESLLLDGQQRLTSLYQTTMRQAPVLTMNHKRQRIGRFYYIDMRRALDSSSDRGEAIVGLPASKVETRDFGRKVILDLSDPALEYQQCFFPTNRIFDADPWMMGFFQHWQYAAENTQLWLRFNNEVLTAFRQYQLPVIELGRSTSREAVCLVFEKVNTGGKKLDAFELLTAIYAGEDSDLLLRDDWAAIRNRLAGSLAIRENPLTRVQPTDFFQALSLVYTLHRRRGHVAGDREGEAPPITCTRDALLDVPLTAYKQLKNRIEEGFRRAGRFLFSQHVYWYKDTPYQSQLVPLAAILCELEDRWDQDAVRRKITRWYWAGVFGELYGSTVDSRFARDLPEVLGWIEGGAEPSTLKEAQFRADRLETMTSRLSAAYKGVHALMMAEGARDFRSGQRFDQTIYFEESVDIHHVFPRAWCSKHSVDAKRMDSIVNRTPLTARTNRIIGGDAPSRYLAKLSQQGDVATELVADHLATHMIEVEHLRADDFDRFYNARREALLGLIERAVGPGAVYRGTAVDEPVAEIVPNPLEAEEV